MNTIMNTHLIKPIVPHETVWIMIFMIFSVSVILQSNDFVGELLKN